jgi:hypothetical protein
MSLVNTGGPVFMRPSEVIERLKATRTTLSLVEDDFSIFGAGDFIKATDSGTFIQNAKAALYVLCGNSTSTLITDAGLGSNEVLHTIDIVLYLRLQDNRAQFSDQYSVWFKEYLTRSLIGFSTVTNGCESQPLTFSGDSFNNTRNVADYTRTYQFNQRVFIEGEDLIGDGDADNLPYLTQIFLELYPDV